MKTFDSKLGWTMTACAGLLTFVFAGLLTLAGGCSKLDSGAHAEPSVKVMPAELAKVDGGKPAAADGAVAPGSGGVGTLVGRVIFEGTPPTPGVLFQKSGVPKEKDGSVCSASGEIPKEDLLVSSSKGVANVFVFLDKAPAGFKGSPPTEPITFDQQNCRFTTHAMFAQVGQKVQLMNADDVLHNTRCIGDRNSLNNTIGPKNRVGIVLNYRKAERAPIPVKCDIHPWMSAYHLILDHPFAAVSDAEGNFKIENLPVGNYQFKVWHELGDGGKLGFLDSKFKVVIKGGDNPPVEIKADAKKFGL